jgi:hypothetical protein
MQQSSFCHAAVEQDLRAKAATYNSGRSVLIYSLHSHPGVGVILVWRVLVQVCQLVEQQGGVPPGHDLGPLLHLYKARLALACNNHKAAKKEVGGLLGTCGCVCLPVVC